MIEIKSEGEIRLIRAAGGILSRVLDEVCKAALPGTTTIKLDALAEELILKSGGRPAFKGYRGFPASICVSVNEEIVHGIPADRPLKEGDIVSIDVGVEKNGFYADSAVTIGVGQISSGARRLIEVTREALYKGIDTAVDGRRLFDISHAIQAFVEGCGYSVVRDFVGHGIGKKMHEEPEVPNFGTKGTGPRLRKGMVLAIEPMVNEGDAGIEIRSDGWTAVTRDRRPSAHFEHTVAVGKEGAEVLT